MDEESTESEWESAEVEEDNEDKGDVEKEEDKAVSGEERLRNAVES